MSQALMNFLGQSLGKGQATGGTKTTLLDTKKVFMDGMLNGRIIRMTIGGIDYYRTITGTTASTSTITFPTLPGTPASCVWTAVAGHVITTTCVADGGNDYTIVAALAVGNNKPLTVTLVGNVITIALATGAGGASNDAANTATLVAAAIDALPEFTSSVTSGDGSGVVAATSAPVAFSGGVDEVKPVSGTHYEVVGGIGSAVSLSGSNAIKGAVRNNVAAGTGLQISSTSYPCHEVTIIALRTNTGYVYIGGSDVSSTVYGAELTAGDSITLAVNDLNLVYFDTSVSGEGISYVAL